MNKTLFKTYTLLYIGIFVYSLTAVSSKIAAEYPILSPFWIFFYGIGIMAMGIYAVIWQQVLKNLPLTIAYANRAVTTILGVMWGALFFGETISIRIIVGVIVIVAGVILVTRAEYEN